MEDETRSTQSEDGAARERGSWIDRFFRRLEGWPIHPGVSYAVLTVAGGLVLQGSLWACGASRPGAFSIQALATGGWTPLSLAALHLCLAVARGSLQAFRPVLPPRAQAYPKALRQLAAIPTWITVAAGGVGVLYMIIVVRVDPMFFGLAGRGACSDPVALAFGWLNTSTILLNVSIAIRDLAVVHRLHQRAPRINIFDRRPLFAFSRLTSTIAIATLLLSYVFYLAFPSVAQNPVLYGFILLFNFPLAMAAFALPLYGMHQRMASEKDRLLSDVSLRLQATVHSIHQRMETGKLSDVERFNTLLASLLNEEHYLRTIPTWPWEPGALRGLLTALFLPLAIFAAQRLIEQLLLS
jgi:hypothetical protein